MCRQWSLPEEGQVRGDAPRLTMAMGCYSLLGESAPRKGRGDAPMLTVAARVREAGCEGGPGWVRVEGGDRKAER